MLKGYTDLYLYLNNREFGVVMSYNIIDYYVISYSATSYYTICRYNISYSIIDRCTIS
jgi:hypothetical protein